MKTHRTVIAVVDRYSGKGRLDIGLGKTAAWPKHKIMFNSSSTEAYFAVLHSEGMQSLVETPL